MSAPRSIEHDKPLIRGLLNHASEVLVRKICDLLVAWSCIAFLLLSVLLRSLLSFRLFLVCLRYKSLFGDLSDLLNDKIDNILSSSISSVVNRLSFISTKELDCWEACNVKWLSNWLVLSHINSSKFNNSF